MATFTFENLSRSCYNFYGMFKGYLFKKYEKIIQFFGKISYFAYISHNTSIHGLNHIANRNHTALERLLWLILLLCFTYFACSICVNQIDRFVSDPFVLIPETDHLQWTYHVPALTMCSDYVNEDFIDEFYGRFETASIDRNSTGYRDYHKYMHIIAALNADNLNSIEQMENTELFNVFSGEELLDIAINMKFHNESFDLYRPVVTELGLCYSRMQRQISKSFEAFGNDQNYINLGYNVENKECKTYKKCGYEFKKEFPGTTIKLYVHGLNDTPNSKMSPQTVWIPASGDMDLNVHVEEVVSSDRIKLFRIETRRCRFDKETTSDQGYPLGLYTRNLCVVECSVNAAVRICGCRPFFYKFGLGPICNVTGLICLSKNHWNDYHQNCSCLPNCNSIDYSIELSYFDSNFNKTHINVNIKHKRIIRDIKFGIHFLFVSIGGAAGLFLGCSIINISELIYFSTKYLYQVHCKRRWSSKKEYENNSQIDSTEEVVNASQFASRLSRFAQHSSLHGMRFLDTRYGTIDRIYLIFVLVASIIAMTGISIFTLNDFWSSATVTRFDVIDLHRRNTFPAVGVCLEKSNNNRSSLDKRVLNFVKKYYSENDIQIGDYNVFYNELLDYAYYNPSSPSYKWPVNACDGINSTCGVDIQIIKPLLFPSCDELIYNIRFNGKHYPNCSEIFKRILVYSEGLCYLANAAYFYDLDWSQLPLTYGTRETNIKFTFDFLLRKGYECWIYIFSPDDFPSIRHGQHFFLHNQKNIEITVKTTEIDNSKDLRDLSIENRKCRFPDERRFPGASLPYSFVSCLIYNRVRLDLELCNCTVHFAPEEYKDQYCNYEQMKCIADHETRVMILYYYKYFNECVATCKEMEVEIVGYFRTNTTVPYQELNSDDPVSGNTTVTVQILNQPVRLYRNVAFTNIDLVVAIGSVVGLFFGASFLSLIEIISFLILRRI